MKILKGFFTFILLSCSIISFAQNAPTNAFKYFVQKEKFNSIETELSIHELKPIAEKKLHRLANTFEFISTSSNAEDKHYLLAIHKMIQELKPYELDLSIHDKTIIANYIEELMDIVQLKSSNGILNGFVYGFDPTKK